MNALRIDLARRAAVLREYQLLWGVNIFSSTGACNLECSLDINQHPWEHHWAEYWLNNYSLQGALFWSYHHWALSCCFGGVLVETQKWNNCKHIWSAKVRQIFLYTKVDFFFRTPLVYSPEHNEHLEKNKNSLENILSRGRRNGVKKNGHVVVKLSLLTNTCAHNTQCTADGTTAIKVLSIISSDEVTLL